jgi:hypothetical protein
VNKYLGFKAMLKIKNQCLANLEKPKLNESTIAQEIKDHSTFHYVKWILKPNNDISKFLESIL